MDEPRAQVPPDEIGFYQAWLGKRWPRCRRWFEVGVTSRDFDWRSAAYPLGMARIGVHRPLGGLLVVACAFAGWLFADTPDATAGLVVFMGASLLVLWPAVVIFAVIAGTAGTIGFALMLWPPALVAVSVMVGFMAPRWVVAEGRRRWARHAARIAAGESPPPPGPYALPTWVGPSVGLAGLAFIGWMVLYPHRHDHERAYDAAMKSNLRNLVTAEESYFADHMTYTASLGTYYQPSTDVTVTILRADSTGWSATASHERTARTCGIFVGTAVAPVAGAEEAAPMCAPPRR